jgi:hypothetical protein
LYLHSRRNINFISIHCFALSYHMLESLVSSFFVHVYAVGHAMAQAVGHLLLITQAQVQVKTCPCGICGWQSGIGTAPLSMNTSVFPCQYDPTNAPYSFIHLSPTLHYLWN